MERWLHQHIFKVGWLVTRSFQTTTVLYYTFFLPGIVLHQLIIWLAAGLFDVRADRAVRLPAKQEIGQLRLNFVQLSKRASPLKVNLINLVPLPIGLVVIWFIANNIIDIQASFAIMRSGQLSDVAAGIRYLTATPDFWLWAYVLFSISNTMIPDFRLPSGWWQRLALFLAIALTPLFIIGIGGEIVRGALLGPLAVILNTLSSVLVVVIFFDFLGILILGTIEAVIERVTGASATFSNGKMHVMTRAQAAEYRRAKRERERQQQKRRAAAKAAAKAGPPTVYRLTFPVPGPPGSEPVTPLLTEIIEPEEAVANLLQPAPRPARLEPGIVSGIASRKSDETLRSSHDDVITDDENKDEPVNDPTPERETPHPAPPPEAESSNQDIADRLAAFRARQQADSAPFTDDDEQNDAQSDEITYEEFDDSP